MLTGSRASRQTLLLIGISWLLGCSGSDPAPPSREEVVDRTEFESLLVRYSVLETLTGSGVKGDDTNDWDASFEGAAARLADLSTPHNALGDADGNTYIADKEAHAIRKVTPDGIITTVAGVNEPGDDGDQPRAGASAHLNQPNGLWVKPDGTVYILDLANRKVRKLDPAGELTTLFPIPDLSAGRGLWVADDESLAFVCSGTEVKRWTSAGGVETYAAGFSNLGNLAVDAEGVVFVTDRGAHRVFRLESASTRVPIAGNGLAEPAVDGAVALETGLNEVRGIFRTEIGGFLLATHRGSQVFYLDTKGLLHLLIDGARGAHAGDGEPLTLPGKKVSEVRNVTLNPQGDILITENDLGFVRIARRIR